MDAREYLISFRILKERIVFKQCQVEKLRESLTALGIRYDKENVSHTKNVSVMSNTIAEIIDMERDLDLQTAEYCEMNKQIIGLMAHISPDKASLLTEHYIEKKSYAELSTSIYVTERHVRRRVQIALKDFQAVLDQSIEKDVHKCPIEVPQMS